MVLCFFFFFFFFNYTSTTEIYTLSLHDALPISTGLPATSSSGCRSRARGPKAASRSEEHTSELQSPKDIVCRLMLEKKQYKAGPEDHTLAKSEKDHASNSNTYP